MDKAHTVTDLTVCVGTDAITFIQVHYGVVAPNGSVSDKVDGSGHGLRP